MVSDNREIQWRNDLHFFTVISFVLGAIFGVFFAFTLGTAVFNGTLEKWQPTIAAVVALVAAYLALHNVRIQIKANEKENALSRLNEKELRKEDIALRDKPFKDCGILFGSYCEEAIEICKAALDQTHSFSAFPQTSLLGAKKPDAFQSFKTYHSRIFPDRLKIIESASHALHPAARVQAEVLTEQIKQLIEYTKKYIDDPLASLASFVTGLKPKTTPRTKGYIMAMNSLQQAKLFADGEMF